MSTPTKNKQPFWVDCLHGKHECFGYGDPGYIRVNVDGRDCQVTVPSYLADVVVFVVAEANGLLFCFGRTNEKFNGENCGLVMVAKKLDELRYEVGVWHELYPWALTHFGFGREK